MQNYRAGDRICMFGFGRGAYTARALAGMIYKVSSPYLTPVSSLKVREGRASFVRGRETAFVRFEALQGQQQVGTGAGCEVQARVFKRGGYIVRRGLVS